MERKTTPVREELTAKTIEDLDEVVRRLIAFANGRRKMVFTGEIGAGKTTFIQRFCRHLGVREPVVSPTFSLVNEYLFLDENGKENLVHHLDLYRLKSEEEAIHIGIEEYLYDPWYCLIEWPEIIENLLPEEVVRINFEVEPDSGRKIIFL
ncbi:MAG: tRNA (adenosine(37)-N6)-threonylcarbamoyltransferase complex ATPase subunit type 1 TsaE [Bacteroidetes bacterium]|nr:MAG: tRNA (adenosine(37)-N6)-threonylcarbamoyltransferase complex ATPase subunit type 1 TsaE [Bacteroidota bacterium]